jgi:hypothetical protein
MPVKDLIKRNLSFLSVAIITVATVLFTILVSNHERIEAGLQILLLFILLLFGPITLLWFLLISEPMEIGALMLLPIGTLGAFLAATFLRSWYATALRRVGWFLWVVCELMIVMVIV